MNRFYWIAIGFLGGVITSIFVSLLFYLWCFSPLHIVERVLGWNLPRGVGLMWQRDERDAFFGQGSTLSVFSIPNDFARNALAKCPSGFVFGKFDQSGIPEKDAAIDGGAASCFLRKEERNRGDIIVISRDRLFHLRVDR